MIAAPRRQHAEERPLQTPPPTLAPQPLPRTAFSPSAPALAYTLSNECTRGGEAVPAVKFTLNGKPQSVDAFSAMPLLWVLRDSLGMTGTKFGCGMSLCGACTVHIDGE